MNYIIKFLSDGEYGSDSLLSKKHGSKSLSKKNKVVLDPNWNTLKNKVMFKGLLYKIVQDNSIYSILQKIKDNYYLLHHSTRDKYWGGSNKKNTKEINGENILGSMYVFLANNIDKIKPQINSNFSEQMDINKIKQFLKKNLKNHL